MTKQIRGKMEDSGNSIWACGASERKKKLLDLLQIRQTVTETSPDSSQSPCNALPPQRDYEPVCSYGRRTSPHCQIPSRSPPLAGVHLQISERVQVMGGNGLKLASCSFPNGKLKDSNQSEMCAF